MGDIFFCCLLLLMGAGVYWLDLSLIAWTKWKKGLITGYQHRYRTVAIASAVATLTVWAIFDKWLGVNIFPDPEMLYLFVGWVMMVMGIIFGAGITRGVQGIITYFKKMEEGKVNPLDDIKSAATKGASNLAEEVVKNQLSQPEVMVTVEVEQTTEAPPVTSVVEEVVEPVKEDEKKPLTYEQALENLNKT